jgi:precorrin-3B C17-methyltransferase
MHDFASISLSDLLTPWEVIEQRLQAAAGADFVIVLYNPRSKKRSHQLARALDIIGERRGPDTPVGIVTAATRQRERVVVTSLAAVDVESVDMQTTVIVGNSHTFVWRGKMITPRGYRSKYRLD